MKRTAFSPHEKIYINHVKTRQKHDMAVQHYHDAYEIYFQVDGKRNIFSDNICYTVESGDIAIFKPFEIHYAESRDLDYYERYVINFQADTLRSILTDEEMYFLFEEKIQSCFVHLPQSGIQEILKCFRDVEMYSGRNGFLSDKLLSSAVLQLIMKVMDYADKRADVASEHISPQIIAALNYIKNHYKENITLDEISAAAHMSKYYFCRIFHDVTGATAIEYLNNVRLTKVHNLLLNTNLTIDEIASFTGYATAVKLTRAFKKVYGTAPREFRKSRRD